MKSISIHLVCIVFSCVFVQAQVESDISSQSQLDEYMETGMEVAGIRAPHYDKDGNLQAQLYGGRARIIEGGVTDVTNLRIDVFRDDVVFMTIFAPQCFTEIKESGEDRELVAYSDGEVLIDMDQMTISGKGFRFSSEENRFEILHNSKVLVKETAY
ncbi:MAG TPA: hypothetical protein VIR63_01090, partial [Pontiella sp.]